MKEKSGSWELHGVEDRGLNKDEWYDLSVCICTLTMLGLICKLHKQNQLV